MTDMAERAGSGDTVASEIARNAVFEALGERRINDLVRTGGWVSEDGRPIQFARVYALLASPDSGPPVTPADAGDFRIEMKVWQSPWSQVEDPSTGSSINLGGFSSLGNQVISVGSSGPDSTEIVPGARTYLISRQYGPDGTATSVAQETSDGGSRPVTEIEAAYVWTTLNTMQPAA